MYQFCCSANSFYIFHFEFMRSSNLLINNFRCEHRIPKQSNFWSTSSHGAKTWVFCGSALSSKNLVGSNFEQKFFWWQGATSQSHVALSSYDLWPDDWTDHCRWFWARKLSCIRVVDFALYKSNWSHYKKLLGVHVCLNIFPNSFLIITHIFFGFLLGIQCCLIKFARHCGATVARFWRPDITHVITATDASGSCRRTMKVLMGILYGRWVISMDCKIILFFINFSPRKSCSIFLNCCL